jgi:hypothetical protein
MSRPESSELLLEVEKAPGPGIDFEHVDRELIGMRARAGGIWLGFDRAAVVETDDGSGSRLAAVVAVPVSTFAGCRLRARVAGAWREEGRLVLVAQLLGVAAPLPALARLAADVADDATWLEPETALSEVQRARRRFRERRAHARILGGRAWHGVGRVVEESRFTTPHSAAEYRLDRLPPRFLRGLEGLLDDDERLLYTVERPEVRDASIMERVARREDRRAALLALTDRQLLWIVDHANPDRYLSDWGVDVEVVPVERIERVEQVVGSSVQIHVVTPAGTRSYRLPLDLSAECTVMLRLLRRFLPSALGSLPRRVYEIPGVEPDALALDAFGQAVEARDAVDLARRSGPVLGAFYDPRRTGVRRTSLLVLRDDEVFRTTGDAIERLPLNEVTALGITLSALVGRLVVIGRSSTIDLRFPSPLAAGAAAWLRSVRRALANR